MMDITDGYPLQWPLHWPRTSPNKRQGSRFGKAFGKSRDQLMSEVRMLGGKNTVISSNLSLRRDGLPYANMPSPADPGVAVYFTLFDEQQCIPCDKWNRVVDNIIAVEKTVAALRGIDRWGAKEMVRAAFRGFKALPAPADIMLTQADYFADCCTDDEVKKKYKVLAKELHPDLGGSSESFNEMSRQYRNRTWEKGVE